MRKSGLTDEILHKLFRVGDDGELYRKPIEYMGFCTVYQWNALAFHKKPIKITHLSLKVAGFNGSYKTAFIYRAVVNGVDYAYTFQDRQHRQAIEQNLKKARDKKGVTSKTSEKCLSAGRRTTEICNLNRGMVALAKQRANPKKPQDMTKPTIQQVLEQARKTSNFRQAYLSALKAGAYHV